MRKGGWVTEWYSFAVATARPIARENIPTWPLSRMPGFETKATGTLPELDDACGYFGVAVRAFMWVISS
jgi:hypothetical protein